MKDSKPFGNKIAQKFNIGDLVRWTEWGQNSEGNLVRYTGFGMLVNIIIKTLGEREVVFATVLPADESQTIELSMAKIRKMETN